eukprot:scaffold22566_cov36-Prasinocladus_malaysianus.AAC.1
MSRQALGVISGVGGHRLLVAHTFVRRSSTGRCCHWQPFSLAVCLFVFLSAAGDAGSRQFGQTDVHVLVLSVLASIRTISAYI